MNFVRALNEIHSNWMGFFIISCGVMLTCCHQSTTGVSLITGGFAIINSSVKGTTEIAKTPSGTTSTVEVKS